MTEQQQPTSSAQTSGDELNPTPQPTARYPRPAVSRDTAELVWRDLSTQAMAASVKDEVVRLAVIAGLTRATGARYSDLLRCRLEDFTFPAAGSRTGEGSVVVEHGKHRTARRHRLGPEVVMVLNRWLEVRTELCAGLQGSPPRALLLTVHHTHDNGTTVSSGLPITKQGLVLSWRRYVHRTNARYGATRDPLPTRFEQVRRAWYPDGPHHRLEAAGAPQL